MKYFFTLENLTQLLTLNDIKTTLDNKIFSYTKFN